jgi:hypothetical protein
MSCVATPLVHPCVRANAARRRRRGGLIALVAAAATSITTASVPSAASAQILPPVDPSLTGATAQLLELAGGIGPRKLRMIEEEGYLCFMVFHRVPSGISWVCIPPLQ